MLPGKARKTLLSSLLLGASLVVLSVRPASSDGSSVQEFEPTDAYSRETIEGWPIRLNKRFRQHDERLCTETLDLLRQQLYLITRNLPPAAVDKLRKVTIWVEEAEPHHSCMCYHPDPGWLREHDMNPDKARSVELANARNFLSWTKDQPWMVFHELAHAYHHQFLDDGFDNKDVRRAFERTQAAKNYESVLHINGRHERHYALTNPQEYFAESSEACFGTNDFYPFVRSELKEADPDGCALVERLWGKRS
ncbi:MAG TPA: hypothetical protein VHC22_02650 [Pirellulales bacterium]|nr:hypothetical protein [Pirellulales bacterium]